MAHAVPLSRCAAGKRKARNRRKENLVPPDTQIEIAREETMSQRNGDKARFGRQLYQKILLRKHMRELRKALAGKAPEPAVAIAK